MGFSETRCLQRNKIREIRVGPSKIKRILEEYEVLEGENAT